MGRPGDRLKDMLSHAIAAFERFLLFSKSNDRARPMTERIRDHAYVLEYGYVVRRSISRDASGIIEDRAMRATPYSDRIRSVRDWHLGWNSRLRWWHCSNSLSASIIARHAEVNTT